MIGTKVVTRERVLAFALADFSRYYAFKPQFSSFEKYELDYFLLGLKFYDVLIK